MKLVNWKLAGCLAIAGMLMLPLAAQAKNKAVNAHKAPKHAALKLGDLPAPAAAAIAGVDKNAHVKHIAKIQGKGKFAGRTYYVARLAKGHQHATVKVTAAGKVVRHAKWHDNKVAKVGKPGKAHKGKAAA